MKKIFFILLLLILPNLSRAETADDYLVNNVQIAKFDKDATTARKNAINKAQRQAFNIVMDRLGIDSTNNIIINDDEISRTIRSMQIKHEKITVNSYSASMNFEFSPDYVKYTLNKYGINKFSQKLDSYLIVPLMNDGRKDYLWDNGNKWFAYFKKNLNGINNIFIANNNFSNQLQVKDDAFEKPEFSDFENIANSYSVNNVVALYSTHTDSGSVIDIKIYVMNANKTKIATLNYEIPNSQSINVGYDKASIAIIDYLKNLTKKNIEDNRVDNQREATENEVDIHLAFSSLQDFEKASNLLSSNRSVAESKLKTISKKSATFLVKYSNVNLESFLESLEDTGFTVSEKDEGIYIFM